MDAAAPEATTAYVLARERGHSRDVMADPTAVSLTAIDGGWLSFSQAASPDRNGPAGDADRGAGPPPYLAEVADPDALTMVEVRAQTILGKSGVLGPRGPTKEASAPIAS